MISMYQHTEYTCWNVALFWVVFTFLIDCLYFIWTSGLPAHLSTRLKGAPSSFRATGDVILSAPHVAATALLQLFVWSLRLRVQKVQSPHYWHMGGKNLKSVTNTNIWELYWILSSQMTKIFRDNCDKNIVQQTSCESLLPMFKCG